MTACGTGDKLLDVLKQMDIKVERIVLLTIEPLLSSLVVILDNRTGSIERH